MFPFEVSVWFVVGVVNCLSYTLKRHNKQKNQFILYCFYSDFDFILLCFF